jgi:hypothetical protein
VFEDSEMVYNGRSYGMIWICWPCKAFVGVHKAGTHRWEGGIKIEHTGVEPMGSLADAETRLARRQAHDAFDWLWKSGRIGRNAAYAWLQGATKLSAQRCHISRMDARQCDLVVRVCQQWYREQQPKKPAVERRQAAQKHKSPPRATPRRDCSLPDCGCVNVPAWDHCAHSEPALDGEQLAHIRSL